MNSDRSLTPFRNLAVILALLFVLSLSWLIYSNYQAGSRHWDLVISGILLSLPLLLLYFSIGVLVVGWQQQRSQGQIGARLAKFIYRTPRIAGILIIAFVGMFSLDVLSEGYSFWQAVVGFLMHSLPAIAMAVTLALAWRRPWIGFVAFLGAAIFFLGFMIRGPLESIGMALIFSGPMAAIALLFWANWKWSPGRRPA
jgi:hypothetical protein